MLERNTHQEKTIAAAQLITERKYWLNRLSGNLHLSTFPPDHKEKASNKEYQQIQFPFSLEICRLMLELSKGSNPKLFMILVTVLSQLMARYTSDRDIIVGAPIYKQETGGPFINTVLPLRIKISEKVMFKELLVQVREIILEAVENQNFPVETLMYELNLQANENEFFLFNVAILLDTLHDIDYIRHIHPNMIFLFKRRGDNLIGILEYNSILYKRETIERIIKHYSRQLEIALRNVSIPVWEVDILSDEERNQLLFEFNHVTPRSSSAFDTVSNSNTIHRMFEEHVMKAPDLLVSVFEEQQVSYRVLNKVSNSLAILLRQRGVRNGSLVAVMGEQSIEVVISLLAVLKAGGAYLPIDINYPEQRIRTMIEDSGTEILLLQKHFLDQIKFDGQLIDMEGSDLEERDIDNLDCTNTGTSLAYLIFTSGSTGSPKGVLIEHGSLLNFVFWRIETYPQLSSDVTLQLISLSFDGFGANLYPTLLSGGKVVLVNETKWRDIGYIKDIIYRERVTNFSIVPSMLRVILEGAGSENFETLRFIVLGGEKASRHLIQLATEIIPQVQLINEYGLTETSITTVVSFGMTPDRISIIGRPISSNHICILDENQRLVPVGVYGEICISGVGLTRGYVNRVELTVEKFVPDPYLKKDRMYRTGDIGRWLSDGTIELVGRNDRQVQIRGFRIEPGEIENLLQSYKGIIEAVVLSREESGYDTLYAYIVTAGELNVSEIRDFLLIRLPEYMVPTYFIKLEQIPRTATGKIDSKKLMEKKGKLKSGKEYVPPRDKIEEKLAQIWKEELELERVGVYDNYFNLGGDSIKSIGLLNVINDTFHTGLKIVDLYSYNTIEKLAKRINIDSTDSEDHSNSNQYNEVLGKIEELKDKILEGKDK